MWKRFGQFIILLAMIGALYLARLSYASWSAFAFWIAVYLLMVATVSYSLILEERAPHNTLLWLSLLFFLPIFGYILYLYSGQLYLKGLLFRQKRIYNRTYLKRMLGDTSPHTARCREKGQAITDTKQCFISLVEAMAYTPINFHSRTEVLKNGQETYTSLLTELKQAQRYIHMEYYIFRSDRIGKNMISLLIEKARSGVEVRFIYDAIGSFTLESRDIAAMEEAGVQVHGFSPIANGFFNQKFNFRNHRKIVVIDGRVGFTGGLNVGDEYLGRDKAIGFWRDTHLKIEGEALRTLHAIFLLDWEYVSGEQLEERPYLITEKVEGDGGVQITASGPDTQIGLMSDLYYAMFSCAEKSIWIATPYFIPNEAIRTALRIAAHKGIDVKLIVPQTSDSALTQYATASYFMELLRCGIKIYLYQKGFLHQKVVIIDGDFASVGTANIDLRSFQLNFEVNAFLFETSSIATLIQQYEEDLDESICLDMEEFTRRGIIKRTKESFARLFSPVL
ncbi:cardiolipin synthase [Aneurinibacillus sp. REN35]|uniref:cardiolipin synthase n=1 Tax=Aneurinibacillus sp. REN35 TaxID=3237286 RepID=UPI0035277BF4